MSTAPHPVLWRWLRQGGTAAHSARRWQATQARLDGLSAGLDRLPLLDNPWRALDAMPWATSSQPQVAVTPDQDRLQALLQLLSPATAAGAAQSSSDAMVADGALPRRWLPPAAGGSPAALPDAGRSSRPAQAAGQANRAQGGQRTAPVPAPPRQPSEPPGAAIGAAAAAAHWLERSTRAGLGAAFHSTLGQAAQAGLQPGQAHGPPRPVLGAGMATAAGLLRQASTMPGWTASDAVPLLTRQLAGQPGNPVHAKRSAGQPGRGGGSAWAGLVRSLPDALPAAGWADDLAGRPADTGQGRAPDPGQRPVPLVGGQPASAWPQASARPALSADAPWAGTAPWSAGADAGGLGQLTGLRGLAQRASQALAAGVVQPAVPDVLDTRAIGGPIGGPAHAAPATAAQAGWAMRGSDAGAAVRNPADDQQLLLQLARVLRREAERDGVDLSDTAP